jgi:hypothetical protein
MHTATYERLQKRLTLSGRDYLDGFSSLDFEGLTADEFEEIREVLAERARHGDGVSLDALQQILPIEDFCDFAERLLTDDMDDLFAAQLVTSICKIRRSESDWSRVLKLLSHSDVSARRWLINWLPSILISDSQVSGLLRILAELIQKESDQSMLVGESVLLLLVKGFVPKSSQLVEYAKRLQSADRRERKKALVELDCV